MDFLDPNYKKKHTRLLFIGYALLALLIGVLTSLFVLEARGYFINRGGEVVVNSLLFVDSHPGDATVVIGGEINSDQTSSRISVQEGEYLVEIRKDGYRTWQKQLVLEGRQVEFAKYPFLFPENLVSETIDTLPAESVTHQSPDRRWLMSQDTDTNTYVLYDLDDDSLQKRVGDFARLESEDFAPENIEVIEWSRDNRSLLLKATAAAPEADSEDADEEVAVAEEKYFIMKLRSSDEAIEINALDNTAVQRIELADRQPEEVYVHYEGGQLDRIDIEEDDQPVTVIAPNVAAYTTFGDELVMYVPLPREGEERVPVVISDDLNELSLTDLAVGPDVVYSLALARFDGDWLYAVGSSLDERITVYEDPVDSLELGEEPEILSNARVTNLKELVFSRNTRFVAANHESGFVVFDAEDARTRRFAYPGLPEDYEITWMDGHRMHGTIDGLLHIWEFDGQNGRSFDAASSNSEVFFDKNYDNMYFPVGSVLDERELRNTALVIPEDQ